MKKFEFTIVTAAQNKVPFRFEAADMLSAIGKMKRMAIELNITAKSLIQVN